MLMKGEWQEDANSKEIFMMRHILYCFIFMVVCSSFAFAQEGVVVTVAADKSEYAPGETALFTVSLSSLSGKEVSFYEIGLVVDSNDLGEVVQFMEGSGKTGVLYSAFDQHQVDYNTKNPLGGYYRWNFAKVSNDLKKVSSAKVLGSFKAGIVSEGSVTKDVIVDVNIQKSFIAFYDGNFQQVNIPLTTMPANIKVKGGSSDVLQLKVTSQAGILFLDSVEASLSDSTQSKAVRAVAVSSAFKKYISTNDKGAMGMYTIKDKNNYVVLSAINEELKENNLIRQVARMGYILRNN